MPHSLTFRFALIQAARSWAGIGLTALAVSLLALVCPAAAEERVQIDGRFYVIELPARPQGAPLILALHGGGGDPEQFARASGFGEAATARGYAVAFPAGSGRRGDRLLTWNGGYCCGYAARKGVEDEAFLRAVIADAQGRYGLGSAVFMTGMSNGAIMAETFAARNAGELRAVAGVAGSFDAAHVPVTGPIPALLIHGTADPMVPFAGGVGEDSLTRTDFASVDQVVAAFLAAPPGALAQTRRRIDAEPGDGTAVEVTEYRQGGKTRLRLMVIEGGAHHWPGGRKARLATGKTAEISANEEILAFFDSYR